MKKHLRALALALIVPFAVANVANAAIVVGMVLDPSTTAGASPGVDSIYSGLGTWHLFAVDDNVGDFGISLYNVNLQGVTSIRHTAPLASAIQDGEGNIQDAGYSLMRSANNSTSNSIHAAQQFPDRSPYHFTGLGQEAGNFADKLSVMQPGATLVGGGSSTSWGNYNTISPLNGKNWLFLAEGTYEPGILPSISKANFQVYSDPTTLHSSATTTAIVPEPITSTLLTPEYLAHLTAPPPPVHVEPAPTPVPVPQPAPPPIVITPPPIADPTPPPATSEDPQETESPPPSVDSPIWIPPIWSEGWTVIVNPYIRVFPHEYLIDPVNFLDPTDPDATSVTVLPYQFYAHPEGLRELQSAMVTQLAGVSSQVLYGAGESQLVFASGNWMPMTNAWAVDHGGVFTASFGIAQATGSAFFDMQAGQDAVPTPEPAGIFLTIAAQGCFLLVARYRRR